MTRYTVGRGRWFATQVVVSVAAAVCVAALFSADNAPQATPPAVEGKSAQRVGNGAGQAIALRYEPQEQAALASMARFTPTASPVIAVPAAVRAPAKSVTVLPPPRPMLDISAAPDQAAGTAQPAAQPDRGWHVAGVEIPGSAPVRRYVPSGDDLLRTGSEAWSASTNVVRKVATLGGLL